MKLGRMVASVVGAVALLVGAASEPKDPNGVAMMAEQVASPRRRARAGSSTSGRTRTRRS
jgi:hypothetical protein